MWIHPDFVIYKSFNYTGPLNIIDETGNSNNIIEIFSASWKMIALVISVANLKFEPANRTYIVKDLQHFFISREENI